MADALAKAAREIEQYLGQGAAGPESLRTITLFCASPESPAARLIAGYGPQLAAEGVGLRAVFATPAEAAVERFAAQTRMPAGAGRDRAGGVRWACSGKYRRCHEQLVLGERAYLSGATVADVLRGHGSLDLEISTRPQDVAAARFAFDLLWQAADASPSRPAPRRSILGHLFKRSFV